MQVVDIFSRFSTRLLLQKFSEEKQKGFTILEVVVAITVLTTAFLLMFPNLSSIASVSKKNSFYTSVISLEADVLAMFTNPNNFEDGKIKMAMLNGLPLPALTLKDYSGSLNVSIPATPMFQSSIAPVTMYFDTDRKPCAGFDGTNCVIKLEVLFLPLDRPSVLLPPAGGLPDWISNSTASNPTYGYSYRISVDHNYMKMGNRGIKHNNALTISDFKWMVPSEYYMAVSQSQACEPGSLIAGVDPSTKELICLKPADFCKGSILSKQLKISGNSIGLECVPWKSFSCPANYVVHWINPSMLDSDRNGITAPLPSVDQYGSCVYLGADTGGMSKQDPALASISCPAKYTATGSCQLVNEVSVDCQYIDAMGVVSIAPPNKGSVVTNLAGNKIDCQKVDPATVCNAPYSGGSWTANVQADINCTLNPGDRFAAMEVK